jgi:hypothetical protein
VFENRAFYRFLERFIAGFYPQTTLLGTPLLTYKEVSTGTPLQEKIQMVYSFRKRCMGKASASFPKE